MCYMKKELLGMMKISIQIALKEKRYKSLSTCNIKQVKLLIQLNTIKNQFNRIFKFKYK